MQRCTSLGFIGLFEGDPENPHIYHFILFFNLDYEYPDEKEDGCIRQ